MRAICTRRLGDHSRVRIYKLRMLSARHTDALARRDATKVYYIKLPQILTVRARHRVGCGVLRSADFRAQLPVGDSFV